MNSLTLQDVKSVVLDDTLGKYVKVYGSKGDWVLVPIETSTDQLSPISTSSASSSSTICTLDTETISLNALSKMKDNPCHAIDTNPKTIYFEYKGKAKNVLVYGNFNGSICKPLYHDICQEKFLGFVETDLNHGEICFYCFIADDEWAVDEELEVIIDEDHAWNYFIVCTDYAHVRVTSHEVLAVAHHTMDGQSIENLPTFELDDTELLLATKDALKDLENMSEYPKLTPFVAANVLVKVQASIMRKQKGLMLENKQFENFDTFLREDTASITTECSLSTLTNDFPGTMLSEKRRSNVYNKASNNSTTLVKFSSLFQHPSFQSYFARQRYEKGPKFKHSETYATGGALTIYQKRPPVWKSLLKPSFPLGITFREPLRISYEIGAQKTLETPLIDMDESHCESRPQLYGIRYHENRLEFDIDII